MMPRRSSSSFSSSSLYWPLLGVPCEAHLYEEGRSASTIQLWGLGSFIPRSSRLRDSCQALFGVRPYPDAMRDARISTPSLPILGTPESRSVRKTRSIDGRYLLSKQLATSPIHSC